MGIKVQPAATVDTESLDLAARMRLEIRDIGIPPRPAILQEIDREMAMAEPNFLRLAKIIGADVALAASLIKTTNSPFYGFSKRVKTVEDAMLVLGLKVVTRTIAGLALQKVFPHIPSLERFWDTSASTARVSGWLVSHLKKRCAVRAADAYTFALFRDCGIPVILIPFPEYLSVLQQANIEDKQSFTEIEDQSLSINHAILGADLAENWLLPEDVCLAIRRHHDPIALNIANQMGLPVSSRHLIAIAQLAEYLIQKQSGQNCTCEWTKLGESCMQILALTPEDISEILDDYRSEHSALTTA